MNKRRKPNRKYVLGSYDGPGTEPQSRSITATERNGLDLEKYDHVVDLSRGFYAFRDVTGEWVKLPLRGSGLGDITLDILAVMQENPGDAMDTSEFRELTGYESLYGANNLAVRIGVIRKANRETPTAPRFVVTVGYGGYMWLSERTWLRISRLDTATSDSI